MNSGSTVIFNRNWNLLTCSSGIGRWKVYAFWVSTTRLCGAGHWNLCPTAYGNSRQLSHFNAREQLYSLKPPLLSVKKLLRCRNGRSDEVRCRNGLRHEILGVSQRGLGFMGVHDQIICRFFRNRQIHQIKNDCDFYLGKWESEVFGYKNFTI